MTKDCNSCENKILPSDSVTCVECGLSRKNYKPTFDEETPSFERYRLVLHHEYIDKHGKAFPLDEPITAQYIINKSTNIPSSSYIVNDLINRLFEYIRSKGAE